LKVSEQPAISSPVSFDLDPVFHATTPSGSSANGDEGFDPNSQMRGNFGTASDMPVLVETTTGRLAEADLFRDISYPLSQINSGSRNVAEARRSRGNGRREGSR
jgi:hypothetical protein